MQVTVVHQVVWVVVVLACLGVCSGLLVGGVILLKPVVADPARAMNKCDLASQLARYVPGSLMTLVAIYGLHRVFETMIGHLTLP